MEMTVKNEGLHRRLGIIQEKANKLIPTPTGEPTSTASTKINTSTNANINSSTAAVISIIEKTSTQPNNNDTDYLLAMRLIEEEDADANIDADDHDAWPALNAQRSSAALTVNSIRFDNDLQTAPLPRAPTPQTRKAIPSTCREVLQLFGRIYKNERNQPGQYKNNARLADRIFLLTQKNYAYYLLEGLENLDPSPTFYVVGRCAPENSVLRIDKYLVGFSRIEGVFIQSGDITLYMTLGGISTPSYRTTQADAPRILAQKAPNFGELCQSGILELGWAGMKFSFVPSDFGLATKRESTMTDELRKILKGMIERAGEKTTTHMAAITKRLAQDKRIAEARLQEIKYAFTRDPNNQILKAQLEEAEEQITWANNSHDTLSEAIESLATSAINSISANPRNPAAHTAAGRAGMPLPPPAAAGPSGRGGFFGVPARDGRGDFHQRPWDATRKHALF